MIFLRITSHVLLTLFLTIISQVGGLVYIITLLVTQKFKLTVIRSLTSFVILYSITSIIVVPLVAPLFGRTAMPIYGDIKPLNLITCILNRHYVQPTLKNQLVTISAAMNREFPGTTIAYLDANFPFFDGFPLFPHLSHNDGKKLDLAFFYVDSESEKQLNSAPSFIGYGIYEGTINNETNYPRICEERGYWQYGALTTLIPKWYEDDYNVDERRTIALVKYLANHAATSKIFIEPHLKTRWKLTRYDKIRFHGCHAVRHDDHIHTQIR